MDKTIIEFLTTVTVGELLGAVTMLAVAYVVVLVVFGTIARWGRSD